MGSADSEETQASSLDLLDGWLGADRREPGLAVIEDLARLVLPAPIESSRQSDPAVIPQSPEGGGAPDARGSTGVAQAAPVTPGIDLGLPPRGRQVAGFLMFAASVLTVVQAAVAYADPGVVTFGVAIVLLAVTLASWRAWARHTATMVLLTGSRLVMARDGGRHVFDLADTRSEIDVVGRPGDRSWRVLFHRRGMAPYVLDSSMVDPAEFLRVLHTHRAEVHYRPR